METSNDRANERTSEDGTVYWKAADHARRRITRVYEDLKTLRQQLENDEEEDALERRERGLSPYAADRLPTASEQLLFELEELGAALGQLGAALGPAEDAADA